jgi:outer membrane lipopolysaccharide assembly protein LptE/RlpB
MIKKITFLLIIIFFTSSCGFTPIYSLKNFKNTSIEKLNFTGDRILNNYLKSNLNRYKNKKAKNKIFLDVETEYQKNILSKNTAGEVVKYELVVKVIFTIKQTNQQLVFTERKNMENMTSKSDEKSFEMSTKQTFANIIANELIQKLVSMQ